jgi:phosphoglycerol transferase MdoB-like AlkP superfamily enzyme
MTDLTVFAVVSLVLFVLLIKGVVRTFQRNAIVAILMIIFLMPLYLIWAFIELFLGKPDNSTKVVIVEKDAE